MEKTLDIDCVKTAKDNIPDLKIFGNGDSFKLICKASSEKEGWMKSTKAMGFSGGGGCVVQVTTQQKNPDGSYSLAEAICFVPDVYIEEDSNNGVIVRRLRSCI